MKSYKNLFQRITAFDNLLLAARKAQKGKRFYNDVLRFNHGLEKELLALQAELLDGGYQPGVYRTFYVNEPKHRCISAAPYRDRVVHHAVCNILVPLWDASMIADNYACRAGKGAHRAILRFNEYARRYPYVLKCDISKFYYSIDHALLKECVFQRIAERGVRELLGKIIDSASGAAGLPGRSVLAGEGVPGAGWSGLPGRSVLAGEGVPGAGWSGLPGRSVLAGEGVPGAGATGLPIGNLTSQWFANLYLNKFDWFVKQELRCPYVRYMDDFAFFAPNKAELNDILRAAREYLQRLNLKLAGRKCNIYRTVDGVNFLGFKIFPTHRLLLKRNIHRLKRRLRYFQRKFKQRQVALTEIRQSLMSWLGHAKWGDTYQLAAAVFARHVFYRE